MSDLEYLFCGLILQAARESVAQVAARAGGRRTAVESRITADMFETAAANARHVFQIRGEIEREAGERHARGWRWRWRWTLQGAPIVYGPIS